MNAGMLYNKVTIQHKEIQKNDYGMQKEVWSDYYEAYAYVNNLSGSEYWSAAQQNSENIINVTIRYCQKAADLNTIDYRLIFNKKAYDIIFIDNVQYRNEQIKLKAKAIIA